ncbi:MAG: response regulator [Myxococcaceae bacterium]
MSAHGAAVLLVDDSEAVLAFGREVLSRDYRVHTESRGDRAVEAARTVQPAAIVLDLSMPGADGDEVLRRLKADPQLARIPVVMLSSEHERAEECLDLGAWKFLAKPVSAEVLRDTVAQALSAMRAQRQTTATPLLPMEVGGLVLSVRLELVRHVCHQALAVALPGAPQWLKEAIQLGTTFVPVLELAGRLGLAPPPSYVERQLVVVQREDVALALAVDKVHSPEETPALERLAATEVTAESAAIQGLARLSLGAVPVLDPFVLLFPGEWSRLANALHALTREAA